MDDKGTVIPCNFMLTKQAAGYFGISTDNLVTAWEGSIKPGNYPVTVWANGINTRFAGHAKFTINVTAVEPPPGPVPTGIKFNPVKTSLRDNAVAGTLGATFSVSTSNSSPFSGTLAASPANTPAGTPARTSSSATSSAASSATAGAAARTASSATAAAAAGTTSSAPT